MILYVMCINIILNSTYLLILLLYFIKDEIPAAGILQDVLQQVDKHVKFLIQYDPCNSQPSSGKETELVFPINTTATLNSVFYFSPCFVWSEMMQDRRFCLFPSVSCIEA